MTIIRIPPFKQEVRSSSNLDFLDERKKVIAHVEQPSAFRAQIPANAFYVKVQLGAKVDFFPEEPN